MGFCTIPIKHVGYIRLSHLGATHAAITTALIAPHARPNASLLEREHQSCSLMGDFRGASSLPLAGKGSCKRLADSDMHDERKNRTPSLRKIMRSALYLKRSCLNKSSGEVWPAMLISANNYPTLYYRESPTRACQDTFRARRVSPF